MRLAAAIILAASLSGCSWFSRSKAPSPESVLPEAAASVLPAAPASPAPAPARDLGLWPAIPSLELVGAQVAKVGQDAVAQGAAIIERSADAASARDIKEAALLEVVRYSAWAMALGFVAFLLGGFLPIPGIRAAGGWTVALGAAIATLSPWLNDLLGQERVRVAGYVAFSILALALAAGGAWWFIDKVKDEVEKD